MPTKLSLKISKLFFFILCATISAQQVSASLSLESQHACYQEDNGWKFLEYTFVEQPKNQLNAAQANATTALLVLGAASLWYKDILNMVGKTFDLPSLKQEKTQTIWHPVTLTDGTTGYKEDRKVPPFNLASSISTVTVSLAIYQAYSSYLKCQIKRQTLVNFLSNWESNQNFVPKELVPAFNELAQKNIKKLSNANISQIFDIIQHLLEHTFSNRYKADSKSTDMLSTIKTFTDIGKNIVG